MQSKSGNYTAISQLMLDISSRVIHAIRLWNKKINFNKQTIKKKVFFQPIKHRNIIKKIASGFSHSYYSM